MGYAGGKPSWTAKLLNNPELLCKKVREEAGELCQTLEENEGPERAASEAADLLYHSLVLLNLQVHILQLICPACSFFINPSQLPGVNANVAEFGTELYLFPCASTCRGWMWQLCSASFAAVLASLVLMRELLGNDCLPCISDGCTVSMC